MYPILLLNEKCLGYAIAFPVQPSLRNYLLPKYYESTVDASFPIKVVGNFFIGLLTIKTWPNYDVFGLFQHLKSR